MKVTLTLIVVLFSFSTVQASKTCGAADQLADQFEQVFMEYTTLEDMRNYLKNRTENTKDKYYQNATISDLIQDISLESQKKSVEANELAKKALKIYDSNKCR